MKGSPSAFRLPPSPFGRRSSRRGVLLLVVLSLLVLFMLIGTAFLMSSNQYGRASKASAKLNRVGNYPTKILDRAVMQIIRDTDNPNSVVRTHSLLRDLYGTDGFEAAVYSPETMDLTTPVGQVSRFAAATAGSIAAQLGPTQGQMVDLYVRALAFDPARVSSKSADDPSTPANEYVELITPDARHVLKLERDPAGQLQLHTLPLTKGYYNGCLLTITSGPAAGQSTRILEYEYVSDLPPTVGGEPGPTRLFRFRVTAFPRSDGLPLQIDPGRPPEIGDLARATFIVNGRPFNGTGTGYNPFVAAGNPRLTARESTRLGTVSPISRTTSQNQLAERIALLAVHYPEIALTPNAAYFIPSDPTAAADDYGARYEVRAEGPTGDVTLTYLPLNPKVPVTATAAERAAILANWKYPTFVGIGDADESYDAADFQNMFLALQTVTPRLQGRVVHTTTTAGPVTYEIDDPQIVDSGGQFVNTDDFLRLDLEDVPLPSFHRPALFNFWCHRLIDFASDPTGATSVAPTDEDVLAVLLPYGVDGIRDAPGISSDDPTAVTVEVRDQIVAIKRKISLRPLREDHPDFDGSNPLSRPADLDGSSPLVVNGNISVPYWEAIGPWDVDNDNDGVPDSVWVDLGEPVAQAEDGTLYKPLFAFLIVDLDSRLNVNAHGLADHMTLPNFDVSTIFAPQPPLPFPFGNLANDLTSPNQPLGDTSLPSGTELGSSNALPHGLGYGPAEISLRPVLSPTLPSLAVGGVVPVTNVGNPVGDASLLNADDYARLLIGRPGSSIGLAGDEIWGRYGLLDMWGPATTIGNYSNNVKPGMTFDDHNTIPIEGLIDPLAALKFFGYPSWLSYYYGDRMGFPQPLVPTAFSAPPDLFGRYAIGVDYVGQPVYEQAADAISTGNTYSMLHEAPYELNLSDPVRRDTPDPNTIAAMATGTAPPLNDDAPFATADLERILRSYDADAGVLPDRLWSVVDAFDPVKLVRNQPAAVVTFAQQMFKDTSLTTADEPQMLAAAQAMAGPARRLVTTDSYDLPVPASTLPNQAVLSVGADGQPGRAKDADNDGVIDVGDPNDLDAVPSDDFRNIFGKDASQGTIVDLATYRVWKEVRRQIMTAGGQTEVSLTQLSDADYQAFLDTVTAQTDALLNGEPFTDANGNGQFDEGETWDDSIRPNGSYDYPLLPRILAPEIIAGGKMDLNRPFGDGRDNGDGIDNDGDGEVDESDERFAANPDPLLNGVVDEPWEAGEPFIDANGNGRFDPGEYFVDIIGGNGNIINDETRYNGPRDQLWAGLTAEPIGFDYNHGGVVTDGRLYDVNGNGDYDDPEDGRLRHNGIIQRQTMARHLYCLMMLLVDEHYIASQNFRPEVPAEGGVYDISFLDEKGNFDLFILHQQLALQMAENKLRENGQLTPTTDTSSQAFKTLLGDAVIEAKPYAYAWVLRKLTARRIAQWAINCVDYRDADSIMTPFEYDENPWDGWGVYDETGTFLPLDGDVATNENWGDEYPAPRKFNPYLEVENNRNHPEYNPPYDDVALARVDGTREEATRDVVWGVERPELLITETLAFHDRRATDESDPQGFPAHRSILDSPSSNTGIPPDFDLDQKLKPRGSLFVELYNPWSEDGQRPAELYDRLQYAPNRFTQPGVMLNRLSGLAESTSDKRSPVWRMAVLYDPFTGKLASRVIDPTSLTAQEDNAKQGLSTDPDGFAIELDKHAERLVYFTTGDNYRTYSDKTDPSRAGDESDLDRLDDQRLTTQLDLQPAEYLQKKNPLTGQDFYTPKVDQLGVRVPPLPVRWAVAPGSGATQEKPYPAARRYFIARTERDGFGGADDRDAMIAPILPGRYAVIGSSGLQLYDDPVDANRPQASGKTTLPARKGDLTTRYVTSISRLVGSGGDEQTTDQHHRRLFETRRIELWPYGGQYFNMSARPDPNWKTRPDPTTQQQVLIGENGGPEFVRMGATVVNVTDSQPAGATKSSDPVGYGVPNNTIIDPCVAIPIEDLSISEPVEGYPSLLYQKLYVENNPGVGALAAPAEVKINAEGEIEFTPSYDRPLDMEEATTKNGTTPNYRTVHLQRLANPLLPWNPPPYDKNGQENAFHRAELPVNPYLTIDSQSVDLTAYNGASQFERTQLPVQTSSGETLAGTTSDVLQGNFFGPLTADEIGDAPNHVLWALIFILKQQQANAAPIIPKDQWVTPADLRGQALGTQTIQIEQKLEALSRRQGINSRDDGFRTDLIRDPRDAPSSVNPAPYPREGQWGWHLFRRVLPDDVASDNSSKTGSFFQWLHMQSLERGSQDRVYYKNRVPFTAFYKKYDDPAFVGQILPEGWTYDPNWQPRLLWQQVRPNARAFFRDPAGGVVEVSDVENATSRRQLQAELLSEEERIMRMPDDEIRRNQAVWARMKGGQVPGAREHVVDFVLHQTLGFANEAFTPEFDRINGSDAVAMMSTMKLGAPEVANSSSPAAPARAIPDPNAMLYPDLTPYDVPREVLNAPRLAARVDGAGSSNVPQGTLIQSLSDIVNDLSAPGALRALAAGDKLAVEAEFYKRRQRLMNSTFPWLAWNDRPFVSADEIMQVPAWSSSLMLHEYSVMTRATANPYDGNFLDDVSVGVDVDGLRNTTYRYLRERAPFGHLLNYFSTSANPAIATVNRDNAILQGAPNYYRILDYVEVPSRYVGTDDLLSAEFFNDVPGVADGVAPNTVGTDIAGPLDPRMNFQPPFNKVSRERDPGRVNLNTVVGRRIPGIPATNTPSRIWSEVYDGIMHRYQDGHLVAPSGNLLQLSHFGPAWRDVVLSRRGYAQFNADDIDWDFPIEKPGPGAYPDVLVFGLNRGFPTLFANPFRSPNAGDLVPLKQMQQHGVDASWLRVHPRSRGADGGWGFVDLPGIDDDMDGSIDELDEAVKEDDNQDGLINDAREAGFGDDLVSHRGPGDFRAVPEEEFGDRDRERVPLFSEMTTAAAIDASRNPYMMYQPMTRLGNLVTTRSNVYAVWVTVGYFEVEPAPNWNDPNDSVRGPLRERFGASTGLNATDAATIFGRALYDRVYPEGYMLGQEVGSDTGNVKRQRAFYIIDRTEPVGFKPGEDLNVERAIRVRRRIE